MGLTPVGGQKEDSWTTLDTSSRTLTHYYGYIETEDPQDMREIGWKVESRYVVFEIDLRKNEQTRSICSRSENREKLNKNPNKRETTHNSTLKRLLTNNTLNLCHQKR